jgi:hypothetical protein
MAWHGFASECAAGNGGCTSDDGGGFVCGDGAKEEHSPYRTFILSLQNLRFFLEKKKSRAKLFFSPFCLVRFFQRQQAPYPGVGDDITCSKCSHASGDGWFQPSPLMMDVGRMASDPARGVPPAARLRAGSRQRRPRRGALPATTRGL